MARGDVASEINARIKKVTEDGTAAITKGDLCIVRAGLVKKITAVTDVGPYCVTIEDIAKSATGRVIFEGVVQMSEGNDGALTFGDIVIPSGTTLGDVKKGTTADFSATYVQAEVKELRLIVGIVWEGGGIAKDGTGEILLGFRTGLSD